MLAKENGLKRERKGKLKYMYMVIFVSTSRVCLLIFKTNYMGLMRVRAPNHKVITALLN